jgi:hypothetical protein
MIRYSEVSVPSHRGRGDEWADPWMRSKSPSGRKTGSGSRPSRRQSYSSGSSYSTSRSVSQHIIPAAHLFIQFLFCIPFCPLGLFTLQILTIVEREEAGVTVNVTKKSFLEKPNQQCPGSSSLICLEIIQWNPCLMFHNLRLNFYSPIFIVLVSVCLRLILSLLA